jgi:hypothetical protein
VVDRCISGTYTMPPVTVKELLPLVQKSKKQIKSHPKKSFLIYINKHLPHRLFHSFQQNKAIFPRIATGLYTLTRICVGVLHKWMCVK